MNQRAVCAFSAFLLVIIIHGCGPRESVQEPSPEEKTMKYGTIKLGNDKGPDDWLAVIAENNALVGIPPREGINPFSKEKVMIHAPKTTAHIMVDNQVEGTVSWAEDGSSLLNIEVSDTGKSVAKDIASRLKGHLVLE